MASPSRPTRSIDLNADLGEGFGRWSLTDDDGLLEVVTSANVACGFHAGDAPTMRRVGARAVERGVRIGAQVGYRDLAGFGRRDIDVDATTLRDEVLYQVGALRALVGAAGGEVTYVKAHGALYNRIVHDEVQAHAVVDAVTDAGGDLALLALPGSVVAALAAAAGIRVVAEAYPDRGYRPDGTLVSRREPGALVAEAGAVAARAVDLATARTVTDVAGTVVPVAADSLCLHGDAPDAVVTAARVRQALADAGVALLPFT